VDDNEKPPGVAPPGDDPTPLRGVVLDPSLLAAAARSTRDDGRPLTAEERARGARVDSMIEALDAGRVERPRFGTDPAIEAAARREAELAADAAEKAAKEAEQLAAFERKQEQRRENLAAAANFKSAVRKRYVFNIAGREFITMESGVATILDAIKSGENGMVEIPVGIPNEEKSFLMWINVAQVVFIRPTS